MTQSRFWKVIAVLSVVAVFYVGHGLHEKTGLGVPSLANEARADGVAILRTSSDAWGTAVTCSPDGKTVYYFGPQLMSSAFKSSTFLGSLSAK
jgi:hypothetical protein